ncbi:hypothetical protein FBY54_0084 [Zymomonas mobilis]|nr:hypothetical protein FBY55_0652 [Zymomonas mobilis]TQL29282.1 hypothetical protein FBY54_0084 [Zymomonas mobilis]
MAKLKSAITISTVLLPISGSINAMALSPKMPLHHTETNRSFAS